MERRLQSAGKQGGLSADRASGVTLVSDPYPRTGAKQVTMLALG